MLAGTFEMIIKMSLVTSAYVILTFLLWRFLKDREMNIGDRIGLGFLYGILSVFSTLMLENKPVNIFEDGLESRDFINVKDIAKGVIDSIEKILENMAIHAIIYVSK